MSKERFGRAFVASLALTGIGKAQLQEQKTLSYEQRALRALEVVRQMSGEELVINGRKVKLIIKQDRYVTDQLVVVIQNPKLQDVQYENGKVYKHVIADVVNLTTNRYNFIPRIDLGEATYAASLIKKEEQEADDKGIIASYINAAQYYYNKDINLTYASIALTQNMRKKGIAPGETFSFLKHSSIGSLISSPMVKVGFDTHDNIVRAGGICAGVTTVAKAAARAQLKGFVDITAMQPHSKKDAQYFKNPLDDAGSPDATAFYYPNGGVDFRFTNTSDKTLYVVNKVQLTPNKNVNPKNFNPLSRANPTGKVILQTTIQTKPPAEEDIAFSQNQLQAYRTHFGNK